MLDIDHLAIGTVPTSVVDNPVADRMNRCAPWGSKVDTRMRHIYFEYRIEARNSERRSNPNEIEWKSNK